VAPDAFHVNVGVGETAVAEFAGDGDPGAPGAVLLALTATESKVAVLSVDVLWLVTINPTSAPAGSVMVVLPTVVHV
jgi:hypothetical protein